MIYSFSLKKKNTEILTKGYWPEKSFIKFFFFVNGTRETVEGIDDVSTRVV